MSEERLTESLQENLLTLLAVDDEHCKMVRGLVPVDLFSSFLYRDIVAQIYQYIDEFGKAPKDHLPDLLEKQLEGDSDKAKLFRSTLRQISELAENLNTKYVVTRLNQFVRQQQVKVGIVLASEALSKGDIDEAERQMLKSAKERMVSFDAGITILQGFDMIQRSDNLKERIITGIPELDRREAGPARGELHYILAPAKRGKTWWLLHIAKQAALQRWNVLCITLEVSDLIYAQRFTQTFCSCTKRAAEVITPDFKLDEDNKLVNITQGEMEKRLSMDNPQEVKLIRKKLVKLKRITDRIRIKQFPTGQLSVGQLNAYLDGLENTGFTPDLLVLDYPDLMKVDHRNLRVELGALGKDLRGIAVERNLAMQAASQVNRASSDKRVIEGTGVAEDYSKIAIADGVLTYNQTKAERRAGTARLYAAAGRNDEDRYEVVVAQCYAIGQFALSSVRPGSHYHNLIRTRYDEDAEEAEEGGEEGA